MTQKPPKNTQKPHGVLGPSLAENQPKTDPNISGQTAFKYPVRASAKENQPEDEQ